MTIDVDYDVRAESCPECAGTGKRREQSCVRCSGCGQIAVVKLRKLPKTAYTSK